MEERRLLLAVALSLVVLTAYRLWFQPPTLPEPSPQPSASAAATTVPASPVPHAARPSPTPSPKAVATVVDDLERRVEVQGSDVLVAFTNRGARVVSWRLTHFKDARGRDEEMVLTVPGGARPLDIETGDPALDERLRDALFRASADGLAPTSDGFTVGAAGGVLRLAYAEGDVEAEKRLRFEPQGYLVAVTASVRQGGRVLPVRLLWGPGLGNPSAAEKEVQSYQAPQAVALTPSHVERIAPEKLTTPMALPVVEWAGVESRYFAALMVPTGNAGPAELRGLALPPVGSEKTHAAAAALITAPPAADTPALLYVGPKDYRTLSQAGHRLEQVVPAGDWFWFRAIVLMLLRLLRWVHGYVGNYGWSIVVLTVLINALMAPLRHYSIANGVKMAKISPELRVIQERYKGVPALDKRREQMQREMSALYAKHGMNMGTQMLVGCLPILLTMPFLIAFYRVLTVSVELRGASFLWIPDLTLKDPYYITPVLMGASMYVMQKMTPSAMDPAQQRMMMLMPVFLMVMFFAAPGAFNLYWLASNVCSIVQQAVTLRILKAQDSKSERRRK
jgi:YidC/Oxa1 family membrane protein insertase